MFGSVALGAILTISGATYLYACHQAAKPHAVHMLVNQGKSYSLVRSEKDGQLYFMLMRDMGPFPTCGTLVSYEKWQGAARDAGLCWTERDLR